MKHRTMCNRVGYSIGGARQPMADDACVVPAGTSWSRASGKDTQLGLSFYLVNVSDSTGMR